VLIGSAPLQGGVLPPDCATWLRTRQCTSGDEGFDRAAQGSQG
jgi:hypothetical protein